MTAVARTQPSMSVDEFLAWEREQQERHEFIEGEVYAMVGGTLRHSEITGNLYTALRAALSSRGCRVYHSDVKVPVASDFFYPDIVVRCGPVGTHDRIAEPVALAEVLSPSTRLYDQTVKWNFYQRLPSLRSFMFVEQERVLVHLYRRSGAVWTYSSHGSLEDVIVLDDPACSVRVADLYEGIDGLGRAV